MIIPRERLPARFVIFIHNKTAFCSDLYVKLQKAVFSCLLKRHEKRAVIKCRNILLQSVMICIEWIYWDNGVQSITVARYFPSVLLCAVTTANFPSDRGKAFSREKLVYISVL